MYYKNEVNGLTEKATKKNIVTYLMSVQSLIHKLEEKGIEDNELDGNFGVFVDALGKYIAGDNTQKRTAARTYAGITQYVEKEYKLQQRGSIQGMYLAIFMGAGVALGAAFSSTIGTAYMGIGIAIGAGLGVSIGSSMEKKAEDEGRLY